jgi:hypothetical protein
VAQLSRDPLSNFKEVFDPFGMTNVAEWNRANPLRFACISRIAESSCREPLDHCLDASGDLRKFDIDLCQRPRRFKHVEVPIEGDFVADLCLLLIDPRVCARERTSRWK